MSEKKVNEKAEKKLVGVDMTKLSASTKRMLEHDLKKAEKQAREAAMTDEEKAAQKKKRRNILIGIGAGILGAIGTGVVVGHHAGQSEESEQTTESETEAPFEAETETEDVASF